MAEVNIFPFFNEFPSNSKKHLLQAQARFSPFCLLRQSFWEMGILASKKKTNPEPTVEDWADGKCKIVMVGDGAVGCLFLFLKFE